MIIKLLTRSATKSTNSSIRQLIRYVLNYSNGNNAPQKEAAVLLRHNLAHKNDVEGYIKSFAENEKLRKHSRQNSTILQHAIISFTPADYSDINNDTLRKVAGKWVDLTAPNCLALAVAHKKENKHVHVVISGVTTDGKSSRLSKKDFALALESMETYQAEHFPFLNQSVINHEKKFADTKEFLSRESIKTMLRKDLQNYLLRTNSQMSYELYFRNEKLQGVLYEGKKYRLSTIGLSKTEIQSLEIYITKLKEIQKVRSNEQRPLSEFENIRNRKRGMGTPSIVR